MTRLQMRKLELLGLTHTLKIAQLVEKRLYFVVAIEQKGIWLQCAQPASVLCCVPPGSFCSGRLAALGGCSFFHWGLCLFFID